MMQATSEQSSFAREIGFDPGYLQEFEAKAFIGGYKCERNGARLLDARTLFHYTAIVVTPAMEVQRVGIGSQYLVTYKGASGDYLDGVQN
jgi:hypothetical protein